MKELFIILVFGLILFNFALAQTTCDLTKPPTTGLCNPTTVPDIPGLIIVLLAVWTGFAGMAILYTAYAGLRMVISQGNEEALTKAKNALKYAVLGLLGLMLSYVIIISTSKFLGVVAVDPNSGKLENPLGNQGFPEFVQTMVNSFTAAVATVAVFMIIVNGFRYITAGGNDEQASQAKKGLTWAAAGIVVVLLAYAIIRATVALLGK